MVLEKKKSKCFLLSFATLDCLLIVLLIVYFDFTDSFLDLIEVNILTLDMTLFLQILAVSTDF